MSNEDEEVERMKAPPAPPDTEWKKVGIQMEAGTHKKLRRFVVDHDVHMRDVVNRALEEYFDRHGN